MLAAVALGSSAVSASHSTYWPTFATVPTPKPTSPCSGSTPDWTDSAGDGCEWYEAFDRPGCPVYGDDYGTEERGVANDNCCYCEGTGVSGCLVKSFICFCIIFESSSIIYPDKYNNSTGSNCITGPYALANLRPCSHLVSNSRLGLRGTTQAL